MPILSLSSLPFILLAAAEAGHEAAAAFGSWEYILNSNIINVTLVAIFLAIIISKLNIGKSIQGKQQRVIDEIDSAEARQKEAQYKLNALMTRAKGLDAEIQGILTDANTNAEKLKASILADAEAQAEKIRQNAIKRLTIEEKQRFAQAQQRLMDDAITATKALLENTLSTEDKIQSIEAFIDLLPQHVEASGGARS